MHLLATISLLLLNLCATPVASAPGSHHTSTLSPRRNPAPIRYQVPNTQTTLFIRLGGLLTQAGMQIAIAATHQVADGMIQQFGGDSMFEYSFLPAVC